MVIIDNAWNIEQPVVNRRRAEELQPRLPADTGNVHFTGFGDKAKSGEQLGAGKGQLGGLNCPTAVLLNGYHVAFFIRNPLCLPRRG
ncbi:hypothetical protein D3C73_624210 [compost metagenome]